MALVAALAAPVSAEPDCSVHGACCFPRRPSAVRAPKRGHAAVKVAVRIDGAGLAKDVVRRYVKRAAGELARCELRDLRFTLVIDASGAVAGVSQEPSPAGQCALRVLRGIRFLPASDGTLTRAIVELHRDG
ncbi:MAG: hypothetical protein SFX73_25820 [Kofleriaceae bacterium]|nr:hypothetical protein [Kofleriaceae bacterium]